MYKIRDRNICKMEIFTYKHCFKFVFVARTKYITYMINDGRH